MLGFRDRLGSWVVAAVALLAIPAAAQDLAARAEALRARGDAAVAADFFELARARNVASLDALELALGGLRDEERVLQAYGAFGTYRGSATQAEAVRRLARTAFAERNLAHARGAVHALTLLGPSAEEELVRVLERHTDAVCRAMALRPLLPRLAARGDDEACRLVLQYADLSSGIEPGVQAALERCVGRGSELAMARELRQSNRSAAWKRVLIDVLGGRESAVAAAAVERRTVDADAAVRLAAMAELARRDPAGALESLRRMARTGPESNVRDAILVLGTLRDADPSWIAELATFARSQSIECRRGVVKALADLQTREALGLLHRLLDDSDWRVQVDAIEAVLSLRQRESVPRLVGLVEHPNVRVKAQAYEALRFLTGLDHGRSRARWSAWFQGEGSAFEVPTLEAALAAENVRRERDQGPGTTTTFYGMRVDSRHVCFVLDVSGSMDGSAGGNLTSARPGGTTRLDVAVHEVSQALRSMLDGARFNLIVFAADVRSFEPSVVTLNERTRKRALRFASSLQAGGGTNLSDALLLALEDPEIDTVFLMTDGQPTVGRLTNAEEIRAAVKLLNAERHVRIHGVAVGASSPLLRGLAEDTGGQYREVW